jgi:hypothetical protein
MVILLFLGVTGSWKYVCETILYFNFHSILHYIRHKTGISASVSAVMLDASGLGTIDRHSESASWAA